MNIKAWLVTGSRVWRDNVLLTEAGADASISVRKSDDDRKVPLVDAAELSRAYALIEEMREALRGVTRIATAASIGVPGNKPRIGRAKSCIEAADAFLAERVK